jgi:Glycosyl transferases group 1
MDLKPLRLSPNERLRIVVLGYIVRGPLGGLVWHHLQYVLGLQLLGHDVLFVEDSDDYPACYHPLLYQMTADPAYGLAFIRDAFEPCGLSGHWAYYDAHTQVWHGKPAEDTLAFLKTADCLLNLSGVNPLRAWFDPIPRRAFVDTDPVFTQIRHLTEPDAHSLAATHHTFFTFGENRGRPGCSMPEDGFPWQPTRQPVVLDLWSADEGNADAPWTTVMQWDSYRVRTYEGREFGMKSASFDPYRPLPTLVPETFELALGSENAPRAQLRAAGWRLCDPQSVAGTPGGYREYLRRSKGEWSVAKHGYVSSNCGWFSERSAAYLACGRPAIVQDTGFSRFFETGRGLFAFSTPEEAVEALGEASGDYARHCAAARETARRYFNASEVLTALLYRM